MKKYLNFRIIKLTIILFLISIYVPGSFLFANEENIERSLNSEIETRGAGGKIKIKFNKRSKIFDLNKKKNKKISRLH